MEPKYLLSQHKNYPLRAATSHAPGIEPPPSGVGATDDTVVLYRRYMIPQMDTGGGYFLPQTRVSWMACSAHSTQSHPSDSGFRAVQCSANTQSSQRGDEVSNCGNPFTRWTIPQNAERTCWSIHTEVSLQSGKCSKAECQSH
jgi:hypothetical protein